MLKEYTRVVLTTDRLATQGARRGMVGYIIEVYGDGNYEAEFSDEATGITLAQVVVHETDLCAAPTSPHQESSKP